MCLARWGARLQASPSQDVVVYPYAEATDEWGVTFRTDPATVGLRWQLLDNTRGGLPESATFQWGAPTTPGGTDYTPFPIGVTGTPVTQTVARAADGTIISPSVTYETRNRISPICEIVAGGQTRRAKVTIEPPLPQL